MFHREKAYKMKVKLIYISAAIFMLIVIIHVIEFILPIITLSEDPFYISRFKENKEGFDYVAQYIIDLKEDYGEEFKMYWDGNKENRRFHIVNRTASDYIKIEGDLKENVAIVEEGFADLYWQRTYITKQGIAFLIEGNGYAFIYTFNGKKPKYMNGSEETFKIKSKSLGKNWYFVKATL
jgi:hypothetical protein